MSQEIQNPFAAAGSQHNGHQAESNPFHALEKATEVKSPFAGVGEKSPFGLGDQEENRPAKLPERRAESAEFSARLVNEGQAPQDNPFEIYRGDNADAGQDGFPAHERENQDRRHAPMPAPMPNVNQGRSPQESTRHEEDYQNHGQQYDPYARQPQYDEKQASHEREPQGWNSDSRDDYSPPQNQAPRSAGHSSHTRGNLKQLELRAIFGVNHEFSRVELIQRARTLPGIRNVAISGDEESRALSVLQDSLSRLGLGEDEDLSLNTGSGSVDFIQENGSTLAVLYEGDYAPGVRETLMIVTREIGRAS